MVQGEQSGNAGASVPNDERLGEVLRGREGVFGVLGRDVRAARGDDDLLLAVDEREEAVVVERAEVARAQPAVIAEDGAGRLLVAVIAAEDGLAPDEDLAVRRALELHVRHGRPNGAKAVAVGPVDRDDGRALRLGLAQPPARRRHRRRLASRPIASARSTSHRRTPFPPRIRPGGSGRSSRRRAARWGRSLGERSPGPWRARPIGAERDRKPEACARSSTRRAKTCASGRWSTIRPPSSTSRGTRTILSTMEHQLRCVRTQPFGGPVAPDA